MSDRESKMDHGGSAGPENEPVDSGESLLRRFNPIDVNHVALDEGTGEIRLKSGAVSLTRDEDGCSVYRSEVLAHYDIGTEKVLTKTYSGYAVLPVVAVRACGELDVKPDPWPRGDGDRATAVDVAHALITCGARGARAKKLASALARTAVHLVVPDRDSTIAAIRGDV